MRTIKEDNIEIYKVYLQITLGSVIMALAINSVFNVEEVVSGGVTGIGIILQKLTENLEIPKKLLPFSQGADGAEKGIPIWFTNAFFNIPLFIAGAFILDKKSMIRTLFATVMVTVFLAVIPAAHILTEEKSVNIVFGGILYGLSYGLLFKNQCSSGGTDLLALILKCYKKTLSTPVILAILDAGIVMVGVVVFGFMNAIYAAISIFVSTKVADKIIEGFRNRKQIFIVSKAAEQIRQIIIEEIDRGVTVIPAIGGYKYKSMNLLMTVVTAREMLILQKKISKIDENAFVIVGDVTDIFGEGFTKITQ